MTTKSYYITYWSYTNYKRYVHYLHYNTYPHYIIIWLIYIKFDFVFTPIISHALITLFCRKKTIQTSAEAYDTHSDGESAGALQSAESSSSRKRNSKGLVCLRNGVVAMRNLDLASRVPIKTRDDDAAKMFQAKLALSNLLFHNDGIRPSHASWEGQRWVSSSHPPQLCCTVLLEQGDFGNDPGGGPLWAECVPGMVGNYMNERVFTPRDVYPADDVKMHLGLTGAHAQMSFMNL